MKAFLIALAVFCLSAPFARAQDFEAQCSTMRDKVACVCALQNGGQVIPTGGYKRQGWRLLRMEARQPGEPPDREKIAFRAKFKFQGWKLQPSPAVQGYLSCMQRRGRR